MLKNTNTEIARERMPGDVSHASIFVERATAKELMARGHRHSRLSAVFINTHAARHVLIFPFCWHTSSLQLHLRTHDDVYCRENLEARTIV